MLEDACAPVGERQHQWLPGQVLRAHLDPVRALRGPAQRSAPIAGKRASLHRSQSQLLLSSAQHTLLQCRLMLVT